MPRKKQLTLVAAKKPQLKKRTKRDWSKTKGEKFLSVLTETCNVSEACRRSRVPVTVAYRRRKMDAAFRASWAEAIAIGYQRLEGVLLERAFHGTEKLFTRKDGSEERMREYPNQLGLQLLKMHRETAMEADYELPSEEIDEIRERLVKKLQRLKKRDEEQETERAGLRGDAPRDGDPQGPGLAGRTVLRVTRAAGGGSPSRRTGCSLMFEAARHRRCSETAPGSSGSFAGQHWSSTATRSWGRGFPRSLLRLAESAPTRRRAPPLRKSCQRSLSTD